jgi:hypothetical protein
MEGAPLKEMKTEQDEAVGLASSMAEYLDIKL